MIGQVVAGYAITRKIGGGGMGAVYYGEHKTLGRPAAIKVLLPQFSNNPEVIQRFFNEARSTGLIRHPGLVDIFDFGTLPSGEAYLAMEYLQGESLASRLRRTEKLSRDGVLHITRQLALAVGAAHNKGIIHRDLKPDNIFLVYDEDLAHGMRAKVLDFGVAKLTDHGGEQNAFQTNISAMIGTPRYMSPEQCRGAGHVEARSDVYSLGCILYEMVCGVSPFTGDVGDLLIGHMKEEPKRPSERVPGTPEYLDHLILWMLKKEPVDRPANMAEVVATIDTHLHRPQHENSSTQKLPVIHAPTQLDHESPLPGDATILNDPPPDPANSTALIVKPITTMSGAASQKTPTSTFVPRKSGGVGLYLGIAGAMCTVIGITVLAMNRQPRQTPAPLSSSPLPAANPTPAPSPTPTPTAIVNDKPSPPKPTPTSPAAMTSASEAELTPAQKASLKRKQLRDERRRRKPAAPTTPFMF